VLQRLDGGMIIEGGAGEATVGCVPKLAQPNHSCRGLAREHDNGRRLGTIGVLTPVVEVAGLQAAWRSRCKSLKAVRMPAARARLSAACFATRARKRLLSDRHVFA
jgi:hypothetical protein